MDAGPPARPVRPGSLAERTAARAAPASGPLPPASAPTTPTPGPGDDVQRHCWVHDAGRRQDHVAGLLVEWRRLEGTWQGRVVYVVLVDGEPTLVEGWLPAAQLRRA